MKSCKHPWCPGFAEVKPYRDVCDDCYEGKHQDLKAAYEAHQAEAVPDPTRVASARHIAGEAANAYDETQQGWELHSCVEEVVDAEHPTWRVLVAGDPVLSLQDLPNGLVRCWEEGWTPLDLYEEMAIRWARSRGKEIGETANEEA